MEPRWYLIQTKPQKERWVGDQIAAKVAEVFVPLLRAKAPRWGRMALSVKPLFPGYVFARFDLHQRYFDIKYLRGVKGLVSAGNEALVVPAQIIEEIRRRAVDGVVEIQPKPLHSGERVTVTEGPFKGLDAIFERHLSGAERAAILLSTIGSSGIRMVLPASSVSKSN